VEQIEQELGLEQGRQRRVRAGQFDEKDKEWNDPRHE
jgi:hypothetical protein